MKKDTHITINSQPSTLNSQLAYAISRWAEEDRPREKLRDKGAETLTDAELLAILIGSGSTKESAVQLMQRIISDCDGNLNTLGKMQLRELTAYNGIGEAKAITILAACELGKRRAACKAADRPDMGSAGCIRLHAPQDAGPRHGGGMGAAHEPALPPHQAREAVARRTVRNGCGRPRHPARGSPRQRHRPHPNTQPSLRQRTPLS